MYSICTNFYPDNKEAFIGYIQVAEGAGTVVGPAIGAVLYMIGGYKFMFFTFGALFVIGSFFIKIVFKADIDRADLLDG